MKRRSSEIDAVTCNVLHTGSNNDKIVFEMNGAVLDTVLVKTDSGMISRDMKNSQQCVVCNEVSRVLGSPHYQKDRVVGKSAT